MSSGDRASAIEIRHLIAFSAVADESSFSRAAERLGYTQSAVSHQVAVLEQLVGHRLVERPGGPRPVSLTAAGERLRTHARAIVTRMLAACADLDALAEGTVGVLRVGTFQSAGARVLPGVLTAFGDLFPDVTIRLDESGDASTLLRHLEEGDLDVTFTFLPLPEGPFSAIELFHDPWVLLVRAGSPLASHAGPVPGDVLASQPLITWNTIRGGSVLEAQLRAHGYEPNVILRSDDSATIQALVAAGLGTALVPQLTFEPDDRIVALDVDDIFRPRVVALAWHSQRNHAASTAAFIETVRAACSPLVLQARATG